MKSIHPSPSTQFWKKKKKRFSECYRSVKLHEF